MFMELHARSQNYMQAHGELHSGSLNCMHAHVTACNLMEPLETLVNTFIRHIILILQLKRQREGGTVEHQ